MSIYLGDLPLANTGYDKANTDLSNLTSQGQNIANWSSNVTNCITEIPQDIKLELNNGTLTLKAGSKIYYNGSPLIIDSDKSYTASTTFPTTQFIISVVPSSSELIQATVSNTSSSASNPGLGYVMWFNTTDSKCYINDGNANATMCSYPICIVNCVNGTGFTSIDQVFNGFGYIGSTVFVLPGVKGLIPNGRNDDRTLKNIEISFSKVVTQTNNVAYSGDVAITSDYFDLAQGDLYNETDNRNYLSDGVTPFNRCIAGKFVKGTNGIVTSLTPKTLFHALDYNDKSAISSWGMPSSRYIDLTLGASGSTYTAPANGYFRLIGINAQNSIRELILNNTTNSIYVNQSDNVGQGFYGGIFVPALKGNTVVVEYIGYTSYAFRFIYAEGEN